MPDLRYAAAYTLSYTLGLLALTYLWLGWPLGGPHPLPHPFRTIAANARRHAADLTRKDRP